MNTAQKIELLKRLLDKASNISVKESTEATFKVWKNDAIRTLERVFGNDSIEASQFRELTFRARVVAWTPGVDLSHDHRRAFDRDFKIATSSIENYIDEFNGDLESDSIDVADPSSTKTARIFVSHAKLDGAIVEDLVEILELIGVTREQIFCSSLADYGIPLGENYLDWLRNELNNGSLVLFVLSRNFYKSPMCLCEMGAAWVKTIEHIPLLIPPFDFNDVGGVIPLSEGMMINDKLKLGQFKARIEEVCGLHPIDSGIWERKRDRILARINKAIEHSSSFE